MGWGQAQVNEKLETAFIYVDVNTGSDSNPGTASQPLKTIATAARKALSNNRNGVGSRVIINPGTYRESISMGTSSQATSLPITFEAATSGTVFVSGDDVWKGWTPYSGNPNIFTQAWPYQWGECPGSSNSPIEQEIAAAGNDHGQRDPSNRGPFAHGDAARDFLPGRNQRHRLRLPAGRNEHDNGHRGGGDAFQPFHRPPTV